MIHERWHEGLPCCDDTWERAYAEFETPEEEIAKFTRRFKAMGVPSWKRDALVVDIFCGRGNALVALERMGFTNLTGVDLSPHLLEQYHGPAKMILGDCRDLRFKEGSVDYFTVQGGLHHLPQIPADLEKCFAAVTKALKPDGLFMVVEPWSTPFLRLAHLLTNMPTLRSLNKKLAALHQMIDAERTTYERWLTSQNEIRRCVSKYFFPIFETYKLGKWMGLYHSRNCL